MIMERPKRYATTTQLLWGCRQKELTASASRSPFSPQNGYFPPSDRIRGIGAPHFPSYSFVCHAVLKILIRYAPSETHHHPPCHLNHRLLPFYLCAELSSSLPMRKGTWLPIVLLLLSCSFGFGYNSVVTVSNGQPHCWPCGRTTATYRCASFLSMMLSTVATPVRPRSWNLPCSEPLAC